MAEEIESESRFVWKQLFFLVKLPFLLLMILLKKRPVESVTAPFKDLFLFIFEPKATIILIAINMAAFIFEIFYLGTDGVTSLAFRPSDITSFNIIPIISSWFIHASWIHLLGNMLFLFVFGRIVEMKMGSFKMIFIYFGSAIISDLVSAFFGQGGIGASGAIAGLVSASILISPFYFTYIIAGIPLPVLVVGWLAIIADISGVLIPKDDNIGHFAHLGGYFAISMLVFLLGKEEKRKMFIGLMINLFFVGLMILLYYYLHIDLNAIPHA